MTQLILCLCYTIANNKTGQTGFEVESLCSGLCLSERLP